MFIWIDASPVTQATFATLGYQGVTGLAFIALDDAGDDPAALTGADGGPPRLRLAPGLVDEVADASVQTLHKVRELADRLTTLATPGNIARIERTLANLESASHGLDRTLKEAPQTLAQRHAGVHHLRHRHRELQVVTHGVVEKPHVAARRDACRRQQLVLADVRRGQRDHVSEEHALARGVRRQPREVTFHVHGGVEAGCDEHVGHVARP